MELRRKAHFLYHFMFSFSLIFIHRGLSPEIVYFHTKDGKERHTTDKDWYIKEGYADWT